MKKRILILSISLLVSLHATTQIEEIAQKTATACSTILRAELAKKGCSCGGKTVDNDVATKDDSNDTDVKACACNKPKPKKDITRGCSCGGKTIDNDETDTTKGCSCGGKAIDNDVATKDDSNDTDVKACACNKPKPKRSTSLDDTNDVLLTKIHYALLNQKKNAPIMDVIVAPHAIPQEIATGDGGELFIKGATHILQIVQGGITAHNSGRLECGLPSIFNGLSGLTTLVSRSANPEKAYDEIFNYLRNLNEEELARLLNIVRSQSILDK